MKQMNHVLNHLEEYIGVFSIIFTSLLVFIQVVLRYLFNYSLHWSEEVARYLIIWLVFIGSSIAVREKAHAAVDILVVYLPGVLKKVITIMASVAAIVFCVIMIISGLKTIANVVEYGSITPSLGIPMYIPYLAIPVGATLMLIRFIQVLLDDMKHLWTNKAVLEETMEEGR